MYDTNFDEINQSEDTAETDTTHNYFEDTFFGFTHHKVMNSEAAEEKA